MAGRTGVLGRASGRLASRVLFVGEAPGRLGADRTGVPFSGDRSGRNFETLLGAAGWRRTDVFVSNAVLCNPRDERGNNRPPRPDEVANCADHLRRLIAILDPPFVVTLGAVALRASALVEPHELVLRRDVGRAVSWCGRTLVPLYHPGARAMVHRSFERQREDYRALARLVAEVANR